MKWIFFVWIFLLVFLNACSSENSLDSYISEEPLEEKTIETTSFQENTVQEIDGVQTITLSWGKLNYNPEVIRVSAGKPVKILADLNRLRGCFQSLVIPELGIETYFDENNPSLEFTPTEKGSFGFSCSMGMGRGTLVVE